MSEPSDNDRSRWKYPRLAALLIGIPLGIKVGFDIVARAPRMFDGTPGEFAFVACFAFFAPLIGFTIDALRTGSDDRTRTLDRYWKRLEEYFDVAHFVGWGNMTGSLVGLWLLRGQPVGGMHVVCVFFGAAGAGFLCGAMLRTFIESQRTPAD